MNGYIFIINIFLYYLSLILHELGHCLFPRIAGFKLFNLIIIGRGKLLFSFRLFDVVFRFNKVPIPIGGFSSTELDNFEAFRQSLSKQNRFQIFMTHFGGNLMHVILIIISAIIIKLSGYTIFSPNTPSKDFFSIICTNLFLINCFILLWNLIPIKNINSTTHAKEFSGNDMNQLITRLKSPIKA